MGISIALFTLGSGTISLAGGAVMAIDPRPPFAAGIARFLLIADSLTRFHGSGPQRFLDHPDFWVRRFLPATLDSTDQLAENRLFGCSSDLGFG
jgi:hypothetical protein